MGLLVSVNCITYNHEKYIGDAIEGFLMQKTNFDFEILIGEDCSTDNTKTICENYAKKAKGKIRLITSDSNVGARKNSERLLEHSRGKYIALCEGDDFWTDPYKLQKQVDYMESHPDCTLCFHAAKVVNENGKKTGGLFRSYNVNSISITEEIITGGGEFCPTASLFFPKKYIENPPDFFQKAHIGDYPLQMLLASYGYAYYIDEIMSAYRIGVSGSWTNQLHSGTNVIQKIIQAKKNDISLLNGFNQFTKNKYINEVEKAKLKREFDILLIQNKIKEAKGTKYLIFYNSLSIKEKTKIYSRAYFPNLYAKMIKIKKAIM